jgi:hypothetical protein
MRTGASFDFLSWDYLRSTSAEFDRFLHVIQIFNCLYHISYAQVQRGHGFVRFSLKKGVFEIEKRHRKEVLKCEAGKNNCNDFLFLLFLFCLFFPVVSAPTV